jgi:hypothetical protein
MGEFNTKIVAEFTPPKTWVLEKALSFQTEELNDEDIQVLKMIGANVQDTGKGTGKITCKKGMKTDLASTPRILWNLIAPWDVARAAIIHDHLYAALRMYWHTGAPFDKAVWKAGRELSDKIFFLGMKSAEPKVSSWKIYSAYWAVRIFGRWPASANV